MNAVAKRRTRRGRRRSARPTLRERASALLQRLAGLLPRVSTLLLLALLGLVLQRGIAALYEQPVRHIAVTGSLDSAHRDALRDTLAAHLDAGLLALPLRQLRDELQALPWVYRASLRRRFPDTLEVQVVEQRPIARWGDGGFLNHEAHVIAVADAKAWDALPRIRGPEGSQARLMRRYQRLVDLLRPLELAPVSLEEDAFGQLSATLDNGVELQLGRSEFTRRVEDFLLLWRRELAAQGAFVKRVDLRYERGAAVAFRDEARDLELALVEGGSE